MAEIVNDSNFEEKVLKSSKPVLVDFMASWCGPCKMIAPIIDELANENTQATVVKLDIDENQKVASKYGVMSIPTILMFKNGEVADRIVGAQTKVKLQELINKHI